LIGWKTYQIGLIWINTRAADNFVLLIGLAVCVPEKRNIQGSYLIRGVVKALRDEGFIPEPVVGS
jgi:hypothetical protein